MAIDDAPSEEIADLQKRFAELDQEWASVLTALQQLSQRRTAEVQATPPSQTVRDVATTTAMSNAEKVALFRSFFRGRDDVFPCSGAPSVQSKLLNVMQ